MRNISITTPVFAAIWSNRKDGEDSEDAILARLLGCAKKKENATVDTPIHISGAGVVDRRNGVTFPEGFQIFRFYKGREYVAEAHGGSWRRSDDGSQFSTLNQLNHSIALGAENVWNGNWKYRTDDGSIKSIATLRRQ